MIWLSRMLALFISTLCGHACSGCNNQRHHRRGASAAQQYQPRSEIAVSNATKVSSQARWARALSPVRRVTCESTDLATALRATWGRSSMHPLELVNCALQARLLRTLAALDALHALLERRRQNQALVHANHALLEPSALPQVQPRAPHAQSLGTAPLLALRVRRWRLRHALQAHITRTWARRAMRLASRV